MASLDYNGIFTKDKLVDLFPEGRTNAFFDALFGDASEGAYDISLDFKGNRGNDLVFEFILNQRPGKCLVCNLTYGLPEVFQRHPIIDVKGLVKDIAGSVPGAELREWAMGSTRELSRARHVIPFTVSLDIR